ncbi:hypothetical protein IGB42_02279 [Andreprevotia sp. IGB-42]|uniref:AsmA family protein n=1 Tax=Andreprevotia sp. IGB-42 TaxID=2497473 RepID=UPI001359044E|nr:AsmA family protein [Andreprevotia sp. IGB-42]KAF0813350.1 hypothetical protein IGB42_02279 [Andreprevotia sp. IGB-42]
MVDKTTRKTHRLQAWKIIVLALLLIIALAIYLFEWNMLRGPISRRVTAATGRPFAINGDLHVQLSRNPTVTAERLSFGNASWGSKPEMASLERISVQFNLKALFHREVRLLNVVAENPQVLLEKNPQGQGNWQFGNTADDKAAEPGKWQVHYGNVAIRQGVIHYLDTAGKTDVTAKLDTIGGITGQQASVAFAAGGSMRALPLKVTGTGGALLDLQNTKAAYPVKGSGTVGKTRFSADGTVTDPIRLAGLAINFTLAGNSLAELYDILHIPLPPTAPYKLAGFLHHDNQLWSFKRFVGKVGNSDLSGDWSVDLAPKPQFIRADLVSKSLDLKDLSGFVGARADSGKTIQPPGDKVLPQTPYNLEKVRAANADVRFRGQHIQTEKMPFDDLKAHLILDNGKIRLDPLDVGVAGGNVVARITMDTTVAPIQTSVDLAARKLQLDQLLPALKNPKANVGLVGAQAKFIGRGNSVAQMLGSADGNMAIIMNGGEISKLLLRLANLDVANLIPILFTGDKPVPVRCLVTDLAVKDGNAGIRTLILDTEKQVIYGSGNINFKTEQIDIALKTQAKDISLVALRGPILITGPFKKPAVRPSLAQATGRTAAAVALGFVAPPLALLPLIQLGGAEDTPCGAMIREATKNAGRVKRAK